MRGCFFRLFRPARSKPVCRLDGCSRPRFEEPATGRIHDFCGRSHARAFEEQAWSGPNRQAGLGASQGRQAAPASAGRFDENEEYWTQEMVLFWQPPSMFSQWTPSPFVVDHVSYSCAEQFMMAGKARLFGDHDALAQIMATDSPSAHKKLGRGVRGYNSDTWDRQKRDIVMRGSYEKFKQNPHMARHLLDTREKTLAEASPYDPVWGIGLRADDPAAWTKNTWRGQNLLGGILQEVRSRLLMEEAGLSSL